MTNDLIFKLWLESQKADVEALNAGSDRVHVMASEDDRTYKVVFACNGLMVGPEGDVVETDCYLVGIHFPDDYLRRFEPGRTIYLFDPITTFHPNVNRSAICVGRMAPGTGIVDLT